MNSLFEKTDYVCEKCGAPVYKEDGCYQCECYSMEIWTVRDMGEPFPKFWIEEDEE